MSGLSVVCRGDVGEAARTDIGETPRPGLDPDEFGSQAGAIFQWSQDFTFGLCRSM